MRALGNILHECCHFTFVKHKSMNKLIGQFICTIEFSSFTRYQTEHLKHHRYLGENRHDVDFKKYQFLMRRFNQISLERNPMWIFVLVVFNPRNWIYSFSSSFCLDRKNKKIYKLKILYGFSILFLTIFYFKFYFLFIVLPFLTLYQAMKISSDFLDHYFEYTNVNVTLRTRNHEFKSSILNSLFFPRSDAYHLVHHMYPNLPTKKLKSVHQHLIKKSQGYAQRKHVVF
jgi:fatty acid desaturase